MQLILHDHLTEHAHGLPNVLRESVAETVAEGSLQELLHNYLLHPFVHAIEHSLYMLPILFIVFLLIAIIENKAMSRVRTALSHKGFGVIGASLFGLFPQCGFSVAASNLYAERLITAGSLAAVFIATSDEALPIIMADPSSAKWFLPLLLVKLVWAIAVGYFVDRIFHLTRLDQIEVEPADVDAPVTECDCCDCGCEASKQRIIPRVLRRTLSIFMFIVMTGFLLNVAIELFGEERLSAILMNNTLLQPVIAAFIGLIPNCAASIVLSRLFVSGALSFGSLAAGLCAGAGLGLLVLFRVNRSHKQNFALLGCVYSMSVLLGILLEILL